MTSVQIEMPDEIASEFYREIGPGSIKGTESPNKPPQKRTPLRALAPSRKSVPGGAAVGGSLDHPKMFFNPGRGLFKQII